MNRLRDPRLADGPAPPDGGEVRGWYLMVFEQQGSYMFPLPGSGEVVVGRAIESDLQLDDSGASRRHARFAMQHGEATVEDLGSQNGTRVNGERLIRARALTSGDVVAMGGSQLVFHREPRRSGPRQVLDAAGFRQRGEAELERARRARGSLCVAAVRLGGGERIAVARQLSSALRVLDAACWGGDDELLILAPDADLREARLLATRVLAAISPAAPRAAIGLAVAPDDGHHVDELLGAARASLAVVPAEGVRAAADLASTRELAGRTLVVADPSMIRLYALVERLAASELSVLVGGETGSGKQVVASTLHGLSQRSLWPFLVLNCAALSENMIDSELFGVEGGRSGVLEAANRGTVLLDEVVELSPAGQAKLLRVLETGSLVRSGGTSERRIDTRVLAATHRDVQREVASGRFRQDLYFRLAGARLVVPPLRDRVRELSLLARVLLDQACARLGRAPIELSTAAVYTVLAHSWPGNVRELKNAMEFVAATVAESTAQPWHLPEGVRPADDRPGPSLTTTMPSMPVPTERPGSEPAPAGFRPIDDEIRELERLRMEQALTAAGGVQTRAAELIGMPLRTFVSKMKLYGLSALPRGKRR